VPRSRSAAKTSKPTTITSFGNSTCNVKAADSSPKRDTAERVGAVVGGAVRVLLAPPEPAPALLLLRERTRSSVRR
jgi:hypothetical protein